MVEINQGFMLFYETYFMRFMHEKGTISSVHVIFTYYQ